MSNNEIVLYYHEDYLAHKDDFQKFWDIYEGDAKTLKQDKYLWKHELELKETGKKIREIREQRSTYTNYCEPIVDIWLSMFTGGGITLDEGTKKFLVEKGLDVDIDGKKTSFESFVKDVICRDYVLFGNVNIYATASEAPKSGAELATIDFKAKLERINPLNVVDWGFNENNKLQFVRIEYLKTKPRLKATDRVTTVYASKVFTIDGLTATIDYYEREKAPIHENLDSNGWKFIEQKVLTDWPEIPLVKTNYNESWTKDISELCLKFYNLESAIDNIHLYQAHQRIAIIGDVNKINEVHVSESSVMMLPEGTAVQVITPVTTEALERRIDTVRNAIFRIGLNQVRQMTADSGDAQAAQAIQAEQRHTYELIKSESEAIQTIAAECLRLLGKYYGIELTPSVVLQPADDVLILDKIMKVFSMFRQELNKMPIAKQAMLRAALAELELPESEEIETELTNSDLTQQPEDTNKESPFKGLF